MAGKRGSPRKLPEIPKVSTRSQTRGILQETEIPIQIDFNNNVDFLDSVDKNFLGQLLNSYKDSIAWLNQEVENKNNIIAELIKYFNSHNTSTVLRHDATTSTRCLKNDKNIQTQTDSAKPKEARKKTDFSRSNWLTLFLGGMNTSYSGEGCNFAHPY